MASLSVCLLFDEATERAVRRLWRQLEDDGVPTLAGYTHGRHVPHVTLASLGPCDPGFAGRALATVPAPDRLRFEALGAFTRSRCSLVPVPTSALLAAHREVVQAARAASIAVHRHYAVDGWLPHLTITPRIPADRLASVALRAYEVLPLEATVTATALVDTGTGDVHRLTAGGRRPREA
jgi:hypothetical protein